MADNRCSNCNGQLPQNRRFCPHCGGNPSTTDSSALSSEQVFGEATTGERTPSRSTQTSDSYTNEGSSRAWTQQCLAYCRQLGATFERGLGYCRRLGAILERGLVHLVEKKRNMSMGSIDREENTDEDEQCVPDRSRRFRDIFKSSLALPVESGYSAVLKGGGLLLLSFLILPFFVLFGYAYRLARVAIRGKSTQPSFEGWELLSDGVAFFLSPLPFLVVYMVIFSVVNQFSEVLGALVYLLGVYTLPAVFTSYIATGSIRKTYTTSIVPEFALTGTYFKGMIVYAILAVVAYFFAVVSILTVVGIIFVYAYTIMVIASYWGYVYEKAIREEGVPPIRKPTATSE